MASQNRTELASILNESAFRWSFGSPGEYARLLESFLKENNLPVPKFPNTFTNGGNSANQLSSSSVKETSMLRPSSPHRGHLDEFPTYFDTCSSSTSTPSVTSGYSSSPMVQLSSIDKYELLPNRESSLKELVFLLLWDLIKEYKASCDGDIPDEVQRFLQVQKIFYSIDDSRTSVVWHTWLSRRINALIRLLGLSRRSKVNSCIAREIPDSTEKDMIVETMVVMLKANKV